MEKKYHTVLQAALLASTAGAVIAFNSGIVETVTIKTENGPVRINKTDYDPDKHELADAQLREDGPTIAEFVEAGYDPKNYPPKGFVSRSTEEEIAAAIKAKETPAAQQQGGSTPTQEPGQSTSTGEQQPNTSEPTQQPAQRLVSQFGAKYFIVDGSGNKLTGEGIDSKGYKTEADAWAAVMALPAAAPVA